MNIQCQTCGIWVKQKNNRQKFCSPKCYEKARYIRDRDKRKKRSLEYYHKNKEKVLKYQKKRWKEKYRSDLEFRKKRQLRDKSRYDAHGRDRKLIGKCSRCGSTKDLHRHHPDYNSTKFVVLCRGCHNGLHSEMKGFK